MAEVVISGLPAGLGSPVFDKLEADLAAAVLSIGGVRSFAIGQGCEAARSTGPDFNDAIVLRDGRIGTRTNRAGGVLGGISTGEEVWFRFAVKPTPSVRRPQRTVNVADMRPCTVRSNGHFDANFTPRAAVVAEAMACLVAVDHLLESGLVHPCRWALSPLLKPGKPES
jgi:chorismate synthase